MDLRHAQIARVIDAESTTEADTVWPPCLSLEGFKFDRLGGDVQEAADRGREWFGRWLGRARYTASAYQQLALAFGNAGRAEEAATVRWMSHVSATDTHGPLRRIRDWTHRLATGYGYYPELALVWLGALVSMGTVIVANGLVRKPLTTRGEFYRMCCGYSFRRLMPEKVLEALRLMPEHEDLELRAWARGYFFLHTVLGLVLAVCAGHWLTKWLTP